MTAWRYRNLITITVIIINYMLTYLEYVPVIKVIDNAGKDD